MVHFPISSVLKEGKRGTKDPALIEWMASSKLTWVTKDDEAKREHLDNIVKSRISSVWIRGIDRVKNRISAQQVHLMLTVKLPRIIATIESSKGPCHFILWISGEKTVMEQTKDINRLVLKRVRRTRRN